MDTNKALNLVAGMCSNKECCSYDIREKLIKWEFPEQEVTRIMDFLYKNKFLDDLRFATFYARDKFRFNKWGKQKIIMMLKQKEVAPEIINEAISLLAKKDYDDTCLALITQKRKTLNDTDPYKIKAKLLRFALGRGFDYDTINKCIDKTITTDE